MLTSIVKIAEIFDIEKGTLQSSKNTVGEFDFITASAEWKTHNEFSHNCEALVFAMGASGSLGRTHYVKGKFIASDLCFILTPKPELGNRVDLKFYHIYFNLIREKLVRETATGTSKLAINIKKFSGYNIHFPDIAYQKKVKEKFEIINPKVDGLKDILGQTVRNISSLRKSILDKALKGKLVPQDPNDEPVSELLKRIKEEKERLIEEGKIKKQTELPPISEIEIPYELPTGWIWIRVGELVDLITSGSRDWAKYYSNHGAKFIRMGNLSQDSFILRLNDIQHVQPPREGEGSRTRLLAGDVLVSITGDVGMLGLIPNDFGEAYINQHTALVRFNSLLLGEFYPYVFLSELCQKQFNSPQRGIKNSFRLSDISFMIVPLPPLNEQQSIVKKVNQLMNFCDQLEDRIEQAKTDSEMLMQAALQELFGAENTENYGETLENEMLALGEFIKKSREDKGISLTNVVKMLGKIKLSEYSGIEAGIIEPDTVTKEKIASILNLTEYEKKLMLQLPVAVKAENVNVSDKSLSIAARRSK